MAKIRSSPTTRVSSLISIRPARPIGSPQSRSRGSPDTPAAQITRSTGIEDPSLKSTRSASTSEIAVFSRTSTPRLINSRSAYWRRESSNGASRCSVISTSTTWTRAGLSSGYVDGMVSVLSSAS